MPERTEIQKGSCAAELDGRCPRILITRLTAVGDCILTMPMAVALRQAFPSAFIAWAVEGVSGTMIERHAALDMAIRLPRRFARSPAVLWRLRHQLRSLRFDITLDPQSLSKSALVAWLTGAGRRIGFRRPVGREISPWLNTELISSRETHVVDRYLELLEPLRVARGPARFEFPDDEPSRVRMSSALRNLGRVGQFAVINPGGGWESKRWPVDRFAEVARELDRRWKTPSLIAWAGPQEGVWAEEIASLAGSSALVAPPTSLLELAAILRQATLFVGSDTGPLHMAAAVGTPCVGLYGPTDPAVCGPYGMGHQTVRAPVLDEAARKGRRGANEAMRQIPASQVVEACSRVLRIAGHAETAA